MQAVIRNQTRIHEAASSQSFAFFLSLSIKNQLDIRHPEDTLTRSICSILTMEEITASERSLLAGNQEVLFSLNIMFPLVLSIWNHRTHHQDPSEDRALSGSYLATQDQNIQVSLCIAAPFSINLLRYEDNHRAGHGKQGIEENFENDPVLQNLLEDELDVLDTDEDYSMVNDDDAPIQNERDTLNTNLR